MKHYFIKFKSKDALLHLKLDRVQYLLNLFKLTKLMYISFKLYHINIIVNY